ncbi:hypothetical protein A0U91_05125 [Acetobacter persici]|uniref:Uncharacterized protein n=4 Tax=Acetobacter persici TaxID=1076596 RepID=A0A1U9LDE3_9PROT|nr:hypothetical protein A0U91_05125 [Acetobacter persici]
MNSNHVEILAAKIQNISPQNQYTILETTDDSGEIIAHGTSSGYGGNTSGGNTGSYTGGNNTGGQGQDPNRGNDGGEESAPIEVRGIRARPDADGQLAIVDDQNNFVREAHYNGPAGSRNYDITVDSTVLDAQKTYSDIEDQQATHQQITDFLKDVAAGQTYSDIRSNVINSPDMQSVMNSYEQQLYGVAPDQNTQDWLKTNLQNGRTIQDVRWEDAHSQRMSNAIFDMINGVQDRNDASDANDNAYKNRTMDALGRKENSFVQNRNGLIDASSEDFVIDQYEKQLYGVAPDQAAKDWIRSNLHNGQTMSDIRWEDAHSQRMSNAIFDMINGVQDRNDASDANDNAYKNRTMDALGRKENSFVQNRNGLIDASSEDFVINQYEKQLYGVAPDQAAKDWIRSNLHNGQTMSDIRWEDAHSQRMSNAIFDMINGVQDRNDASDANDNAYKNITMDTLGRKGISFIQNRDDLINIDAEKSIILNKVYENVHDRTTQQKGIDYALSQLHAGWSIQQLIWSEAHNQEANDSLKQQISILSGRAFSSDDNNAITQIEDAVGNQQITYKNAKLCLSQGAQIAAASDQNATSYTVVDSASPDAFSYTDGAGKQFCLSAKIPLSEVIAAGKAVGEQYEADKAKFGITSTQPLYNYAQNFAHYIKQGGVFDIQRDPKNHIFYKKMTDGSNYLVGVFSAAAKLNSWETSIAGLGYALVKSKNLKDIIVNDRILWNEGINDFNSGKIK